MSGPTEDGLRVAVKALADEWASAGNERSTITRWAAASRLKHVLHTPVPAHPPTAPVAAEKENDA